VDGAIGSSWQIGSTPNRSLWASMSAIISAVELRPEESRRGLEDLIGPPQLPDLPLQRLQPLALIAGQPWAEAIIGLGPTDPVAQRLVRDAELGRDRADRRPLRGVLVLVLEHHAHSPLAQLLRIPPLSGHGSNLSRVGASKNPGAVQGW
jgi:hypothetical protein